MQTNLTSAVPINGELDFITCMNISMIISHEMTNAEDYDGSGRNEQDIQWKYETWTRS